MHRCFVLAVVSCSRSVFPEERTLFIESVFTHLSWRWFPLVGFPDVSGGMNFFSAPECLLGGAAGSKMGQDNESDKKPSWRRLPENGWIFLLSVSWADSNVVIYKPAFIICFFVKPLDPFSWLRRRHHRVLFPRALHARVHGLARWIKK